MVRCVGGAHDGDPPTAEPGLMLCHRCRRNLGRHLGTIAGLWPLLTVMAQPSGGTSGGPGGKPGSRPPCRLDVLDITDPRGTIAQQLTSWARVVIEDRQLSPRSLDGEQAARLLAIHADWIAAQPFADELLGEIRTCAHDIRRACNDLPDPPIGTCQDIDPRGETDRCGGPLRLTHVRPVGMNGGFMYTSAEHVEATLHVTCSRCGSRWDTESLVHIGRVSPIQLWASVPHIAVMLDMSERTLRHWVLTGKVRRNSLGQVNHGDVWRHAHRKDSQSGNRPV